MSLEHATKGRHLTLKICKFECRFDMVGFDSSDAGFGDEKLTRIMAMFDVEVP